MNIYMSGLNTGKNDCAKKTRKSGLNDTRIISTSIDFNDDTQVKKYEI